MSIQLLSPYWLLVFMLCTHQHHTPTVSVFLLASQLQPPRPQIINTSYCYNLFHERSFIPSSPIAPVSPPPVLYSFQGSGNTWVRLLIEYATGKYTGSVYNDGSLLSILPGEHECSHRVVAIKAHPFTHPFSDIKRKVLKQDANKCNR